MKTTSPFYRTGVSKSPLLDTTHGKKGHAHPHTSKEYRAKRKTEIDAMQHKLKQGSFDATSENKDKFSDPKTTKYYNELSAKIDAHDLETTKKVRGID